MKKILILILFFFISSSSFCQLNDLRERMYLHTSRQTLICGETLYFSVFNLSDESGKLTDLSKIGYIQLVGKNGVVATHKVMLDQGRGWGSIFISSMIPSGKYYLVGNTRWMNNFEDYVTVPIAIINPFEKYNEPQPQSEDWKISVHQGNAGDIIGNENEIVLSVTDVYGLRPQFKGRLINSDNEKLTDFSAYRPGFAKFEIPHTESQGSYKIVLEDESNSLHFLSFDFPETSNSILSVKDLGEFLSLQTNAIDASLAISSDQNTLHELSFEYSPIIRFPKNKLEPGVLFFDLQNKEGKTLATKKYYYSEDKEVPLLGGQPIYEKRSMVQQSFEVPSGKYALSVRRKFDYLKEGNNHSVQNKLDFYSQQHSFERLPIPILLETVKRKSKNVEFSFLPEHHNELLAGKITDNNNKPGINTFVTLSLLAEKDKLTAARTNENGEFLLHFPSPGKDSDAIIKAFDMATYRYDLENKYVNFQFPQLPPLKLDSLQIQEVLKLNIYNQIENAYLNASDSSLVPVSFSQYGPFDNEYVLDDYIRFPKMQEHFTEYFLGAKVRKGEIEILQKFSVSDFNEKPILLLDGVPVTSATILNLNPYKVRRVGIITNRVYLGPMVADGMLYVETFSENMGGAAFQTFGHFFKVQRLSSPVGYSFPEYKESQRKKIPDKRTILLWDPNIVKHKQDRLQIEFSTSDISGNYEAVLEGFTDEGRPVTVIRSFEVR